MATFKLNKASIALIDGVSNNSGSFKSATLDVRTSHGGTISVQIKNGASAPSLACTVYIGISHDSGSTPPASDNWGDSWMLLTTLPGTTTNDDIRNFPPVIIPAGAQHIMVYAKGNTNQAVTITAKATIVESVLREE